MKVTVYTFPWVVAPLSLKWWSTLDIRHPVVPLRLFHRSFIIHKPSSASEWMPLRHLGLPHFFLPLSHQWFSRAWINSKGAQLTSSDIFFWCLLGKNPRQEGRKKVFLTWIKLQLSDKKTVNCKVVQKAVDLQTACKIQASPYFSLSIAIRGDWFQKDARFIYKLMRKWTNFSLDVLPR